MAVPLIAGGLKGAFTQGILSGVAGGLSGGISGLLGKLFGQNKQSYANPYAGTQALLQAQQLRESRLAQSNYLTHLTGAATREEENAGRFQANQYRQQRDLMILDHQLNAQREHRSYLYSQALQWMNNTAQMQQLQRSLAQNPGPGGVSRFILRSLGVDRSGARGGVPPESFNPTWGNWFNTGGRQ